MFLWNFVNLIDAEGGWIVQLIALFTGAFIATRLIAYLCKKYAANGTSWQQLFLSCFYKPLASLIWIFVVLFSANLVTDGLLDSFFSNQFKLVLKGILIVVGAWFLLKCKRQVMQLKLQKLPYEEHGKIVVISKLLTAVILIFALMLLMEATGIGIKTFIAFGGISGLALAFASQDIIANFFGGLMILIISPFELHDRISVPASAIDGTVQEIGWYETRLIGSDKRALYVPNSLFTKAAIFNGSRVRVKALQETVEIRHQDLQKIPNIIKDILSFFQEHAGFLDGSSPQVFIGKLTSSSIQLEVQAGTNLVKESAFFAFRNELFLYLGQVLDKHGAQMVAITPYKQL